NPAEVRQGPRKGLRTLGDLEDRALRLLQALDDDQKKVAICADKADKDISSTSFKGESGGLSTSLPTVKPQGIAASKLNPDQRKMLMALIETYAADMAAPVGVAWLNEIIKSGQDGQDSIHFAWFGTPDRSAGHAYAVQGPTFLIEFNNTQNEANHVHAAWRSTLGDFGIPVKK
ncbi:MAG: DUF3500 domain-containing protein, partial [Isosphaeraceae bacterium]